MRRFYLSVLAIVMGVALLGAAEDSEKAAATREKLKQKVSVDFKNTRLEDIGNELKEQTGISFRLDSAGGVSRNKTLTFQAKDMPLEEVLDGLFKKDGLGYIVTSQKGNAYDGSILIKQGKQRGYEEGQEPAAGKAGKTKAVAKKDEAKKDEPKKEAAKKDAPKKAEDTPAESDEEKAEADAARKLKFAKDLVSDGKTDKAEERLQEIIKKFPKTKAAAEAKKLLEKLK